MFFTFICSSMSTQKMTMVKTSSHENGFSFVLIFLWITKSSGWRKNLYYTSHGKAPGGEGFIFFSRKIFLLRESLLQSHFLFNVNFEKILWPKWLHWFVIEVFALRSNCESVFWISYVWTFSMWKLAQNIEVAKELQVSRWIHTDRKLCITVMYVTKHHQLKWIIKITYNIVTTFKFLLYLNI